MAKNNFLFVTKDGQTIWGGTFESYLGESPDIDDVPVAFVESKVVESSGWRKTRLVALHPKRMLPGYGWYVGTKKDWVEFVANRPDPELVDIVGRPIVRGSRVAVAFALGRGAEIRVGRVVGFDLVQKADGGYNIYASDGIDPREQIVVEWEEDNRQWGGLEKGKQTKIFASLRRAVVME